MALTGLLSLLGAQPWLQRHCRLLRAPHAQPALTVAPDHQPAYLGALWHTARRVDPHSTTHRSRCPLNR